MLSQNDFDWVEEKLSMQQNQMGPFYRFCLSVQVKKCSSLTGTIVGFKFGFRAIGELDRWFLLTLPQAKHLAVGL